MPALSTEDSLFRFFNSAAGENRRKYLWEHLAESGQLWGFGEDRDFEPWKAWNFAKDLKERAEPRRNHRGRKCVERPWSVFAGLFTLREG
jgi:hypothetical protein